MEIQGELKTFKEGHLKLEDYEKRLDEAVSLVRFVSMIAQPQIEKAMEDAKFAESVEETLAFSLKTFEVIIESCKWVVPKSETHFKNYNRTITPMDKHPNIPLTYML